MARAANTMVSGSPLPHTPAVRDAFVGREPSPAPSCEARVDGLEAIWRRVSGALRGELGDDVFGSWVAPAALRRTLSGQPCLVTPTGIARDWVRRHAMRRLGDLWAMHDPERRALVIFSREEFEARQGGRSAPTPDIETPGHEAKSERNLAVGGGSTPAPLALEADGPEPEGGPKCGLRGRLRFDTFVVGPANDFAFAVARRVASWADGHFNPVVFHGPYGFGKTHLLNALAWEAMRNAPRRRVVYLTAERFLTGFVRAVAERRTGPFKDELRGADLLLIDDVHFIGGKQSTQEELFHTLAALMEDGRRVVFSADRPPAALTEIDAHLRSYLSAGLVCGLEPADRALRLGILERKLATLGEQLGGSVTLRPEILDFLADRFTDS
ncbi:MAG: DnaA/Hda family protein, partial [Caulobacteraceae bacterium]